jgi:hypothetical protein
MACRARLKYCHWLKTTGKSTVRLQYHFHQIAHRFVRLQIVPERGVRIDFVAIAATVPSAGDDGGAFEIGDDALHGPFGDADALRHFTQSVVVLSGQAQQNMGVIG